MNYGFEAYFNGSGDDGLNRVRPIQPDGSSEWFIISVIVVRASNENVVGRLQRAILAKVRSTQSTDIHYWDLNSARKVIACPGIGNAPVRCQSRYTRKPGR